jgi:hypothetical protein
METDYQPPAQSQSLAELMAGYTVRPKTLKARNRREEIIEDCRERINGERVGTTYKQLNYLAVRNKVAHLTMLDLEVFYKMCLASKSGFSKCFFGALKIK